jgi:hypothetical protein
MTFNFTEQFVILLRNLNPSRGLSNGSCEGDLFYLLFAQIHGNPGQVDHHCKS